MTARTILLVLAFMIIVPETARSEDFYDNMSRLYEKKQFAEIERGCWNELRKNSKSLDAYYFLIAVRLDSAKQDAAYDIESFKRLHREWEESLSEKERARVNVVDSRYTRLYREIGKRHFLKKEYHEAIYWLLKAKSGFYNDPMLNFFLGVSYKEKKEYDEALKYLKRQQENQPDEPSACYNIACVYANQGKTSEALGCLKKAIETYLNSEQAKRQAL
jgi:tetratricopeptide (TPR) repeat protein